MSKVMNEACKLILEVLEMRKLSTGEEIDTYLSKQPLDVRETALEVLAESIAEEKARTPHCNDNRTTEFELD